MIVPSIFALGLILSAVAADAQPATRVPHVGVLDPGSEGTDITLRAYALRDALRELGWVHGKNVTLELRFANRSPERIASLAQDLVKDKVDVIAAVGADAALAARRATTTIPVVMVGVGDPVRLGLVKNLARPEGNVTGVSLINQELWGKRLEVFREVLPRLSRLAVLYQDTAGGRASIQELGVVGSRLGLKQRPIVFRDRDALPDQIAEARAARAEALAIVPSPVLDEVRGRIAELALKHRLPTLLAFPEYVEAGGLIGYGPVSPGPIAGLRTMSTSFSRVPSPRTCRSSSRPRSSWSSISRRREL